jgi:hypothetical protein
VLFEAISTAAFRAAERVFLECMSVLEQKVASGDVYSFIKVENSEVRKKRESGSGLM